MKTHILNYFISERQGAINGLLIGVLFLAVAGLLWHWSITGSLKRGLAYALLGAGAFMSIATAITIAHNQRRIAATQVMEVPSEQALQQQEVERMRRVLSTAYIGGISLFAAATVGGIALLLLARQPLYRGVAIGLLVFGLTGLVSEFRSMRQNRHYLHTIEQLPFNT